jgi:hypothetical protein
MHRPGRDKEPPPPPPKKNLNQEDISEPRFEYQTPAHEATAQPTACSRNNTHEKIKINHFRILMCWEMLERSGCEHIRKVSCL